MNTLVMFKIRLGTKKYVLFSLEKFSIIFKSLEEKKNEQMHNNIKKLI